MIKIKTLFKKDLNNPALVTTEIDPDNAWALKGEGIATQKFDGSACAIIMGGLWKRYDAKKGKNPPADFWPCQEPDPITGHWPGWLPCKIDNPNDKYFNEALGNYCIEYNSNPDDGTYELCGPKVQGNPENLSKHTLLKHGSIHIVFAELSFEGIKKAFELNNWEGVVFHHPDGRMCKLRKSDFGIKR